MKETKRFKINNSKAGEFDVYLDWSIPNELGIYVDEPVYSQDKYQEATGEFESFASAIINLETGEVN